MSLVVILRGPSGVGKSTIARLIEKELKLDWVIIDVDKLKHYMPLKEDNESHAKGSESRKARSTVAHNVSHFFAKQAYDKGYKIILEEMYRQEHIEKLKTFLESNNMRYLTIYLSASLEEVIIRSYNREKPVPEVETRSFYNEIHPNEGDIIIDTSQNSSGQSARLIINEIQKAL